MSWLTLNRWWLIALAVIVPGAIVAALWPSWFEYQSSVHPPEVRAEAGETVEYAGTQWRLEAWRIVLATSAEGADLELPPGTQLVAALVSIEPGAEAPSCRVDLVDAEGDRRWRSTSFGSDVEFAGASDASSYCDPDQEGPYQAVFSWVTPVDLGSSGSAELAVLDVSPQVLRLDP